MEGDEFPQGLFHGKAAPGYGGTARDSGDVCGRARLGLLVLQACRYDYSKDNPRYLFNSSWTASYWREHSLRATLPSHATALGCGDSEVSQIGDRRMPSSAGMGYIRNKERMLGALQGMVAQVGQEAVKGGSKFPDAFGDEN